MTSAEWFKQAITAECCFRASVNVGDAWLAQRYKERAIWAISKGLVALAAELDMAKVKHLGSTTNGIQYKANE